jgi:hypothetical protein
MKLYKFHADPGHGWLAVSLHEISELGLTNKISSCSYVSPDYQTVYLEEDCDLSLFLRAKFPDEKPGSDRIGGFFDHEVDFINSDNDSFIRKLNYYSLRAA